MNAKELLNNPELLEQLKQEYGFRYGTYWKDCCGHSINELLQLYNEQSKSIIKTKKIMEKKSNCQFQIKPQFASGFQIFGEKEFYSNENLTDERAIALLKKSPKHLSYFGKYPNNIMELLGKKVEIRKDVTPVAQPKKDVTPPVTQPEIIIPKKRGRKAKVIENK
jgi:hypothetical protein